MHLSPAMDRAIRDAMDDLDAWVAVPPAQQRYTAAFRAQVDGNASRFQHRGSSIPDGVYRMNASVRPPSTGIRWPVVQRERGLPKKRIASAQSAGSIG